MMVQSTHRLELLLSGESLEELPHAAVPPRGQLLPQLGPLHLRMAAAGALSRLLPQGGADAAPAALAWPRRARSAVLVWASRGGEGWAARDRGGWGSPGKGRHPGRGERDLGEGGVTRRGERCWEEGRPQGKGRNPERGRNDREKGEIPREVGESERRGSSRERGEDPGRWGRA